MEGMEGVISSVVQWSKRIGKKRVERERKGDDERERERWQSWDSGTVIEKEKEGGCGDGGFEESGKWKGVGTGKG
jgi:hypothetical protein